MDVIKSKDNAKIKYISKLVKDSKFRKSESLFIVEGIRLCDDALKSNVQIEMLLYSEEALKRYSSNIEKYILCANSSYCCSNAIFCGVSDTKTPQGVLFVVKTLDKSPLVDKINDNGIFLALESIQDPTNMGTILRSAEAFGVDGIILSNDCCDVYSPKVVRGSMGAIFRTNLFIADDFQSFITKFNENGESYACVLSDDSLKLSDVNFSKPCLAVIGNEGNGLSPDVIDVCSDKLFIPMRGKAESLNASVAASIVLWEMSK